jgi:hypothetical protein
VNKAQNSIMTMVLVASVVNAFGAVHKSKDITYPIMGGFVVMIVLLALEEADAEVAEMFAGAYAITCLLTNGADLFNGIASAITSGKRFDPPASMSGTGTAGATGTSYSTTTTTPTTTPAAPTVRSA